MNEFMINIGLAIYSLLLIFILVINSQELRNLYISIPKQLIDILLCKINLMLESPQLTLGELPKDFRLNMKRRPPIILGAH